MNRHLGSTWHYRILITPDPTIANNQYGVVEFYSSYKASDIDTSG